jgi:sulfur carrier protein
MRAKSDDRPRILQMITVKGKRLEWHQGLTVRDVLVSLGYNFPSVLVRVNGIIVRRKIWDSTVVPDEAEVEVRPIVAGG